MNKDGWITWTAKLLDLVELASSLYKAIALIGISSLAVSLATRLSRLNVLAAVLGVFAATCFVGWLVFYVRSLKVRFSGPNPHLTILVYDQTYRISGNGDYEYVRRIRARARSPNAQVYMSKFLWTGSGTAEFVPDIPGYRPVMSEEMQTGRTRLQIFFDRPLKKGEEKGIDYTLKFSDSGGQARKFFSHTVAESVRILVLRLEKNDGGRFLELRKHIYSSSVSDVPIFTRSLDAGKYPTRYEWRIRNPRFGFLYSLTWN